MGSHHSGALLYGCTDCLRADYFKVTLSVNHYISQSGKRANLHSYEALR